MARDGSGVTKATENSIQIRFTYQGKTCRERVSCKPTAANIRRLEVFKDEIVAAIADGTFDYAQTFPNSKRAHLFSKENEILTVKKWLNEWLLKSRHIYKTSTYIGYEKSVNYLNQGLGEIELKLIKQKDVNDWCKAQKSDLKTIRNYVSVLRKSLSDAVRDEIIEFNPIAAYQFTKQQQPKVDNIDPFTASDEKKLLDVLEGQHKTLVQFGIWTGLRISELIALEWRDVDMNRRVINVWKTKTQHAKKFEGTKTNAGNREVKLLPPALEALELQKKYTYDDGGIIFKNPNTSKPWRGDSQIRKFWVWAIRRCKIRYRYPYQMRHTYASRMLTAGENIPWISNQMGHKHVTTTMVRYARFIADTLPEAGNKAVQLFASQEI